VTTSAVRMLLDRVLIVLEESRDVDLDIRITGSSLTLVANLGQQRAAPRKEAVASPTIVGDQAELIKGVLSSGAWLTLRDLAQKVAPGQAKSAIKDSLVSMVRSGVLQQSIRGYRLAGVASRRGRPKKGVSKKVAPPPAKVSTPKPAARPPARKASAPKRAARMPAKKPTPPRPPARPAPKAVKQSSPKKKPAARTAKPVLAESEAVNAAPSEAPVALAEEGTAPAISVE
jgi:hypothetical protein